MAIAPSRYCRETEKSQVTFYLFFTQTKNQKTMKPPKPEDLQRQLEELVHQRFGDKIEILSTTPSFEDEPSKEQAENKEDKMNKTDDFDLSFNYKPKEIKEHLDRYVIGQDEAKKAISIALCDHYKQVTRHQENPEATKNDNYTKQNLLVLGSTGVGKTYMIKQAAKLIGVPFVKADATRFSETGYMGANVDDLIKDLASQSSGDLSRAQYGIIYLDEVDKLASQSGHSGKDVSGRGVQLGLLKLMEETDVDLRSGNDPASQIQAFMELQRKGRVEKQVINTKYILFIASGAFTGLEKIIEKRLNKKAIGFRAVQEEKTTEKNSLQEATTEDFIGFGLEPEFVGRLPVRVSCHNLDADVLYHILKSSEGSILKQYQISFAAHGIKIHFEDCAIREIARLASSEKTGARGLSTICETFLRDFKFELPSSDIKEFRVTKSLIQNPKETLKELFEDLKEKLPQEFIEDLAEVKNRFLQNFDISLAFSHEASWYLLERGKKEKKTVLTLCEEILSEYGHALRLVQRKTGKDDYTITKDLLLKPREVLEHSF